jgi:ABC-2 type transport system permease protein
MRRLLRQTSDLTLASLKMLVRDRTAVLAAAIFPVLFLLVFSLYDLSLTPLGDFAGTEAVGPTGAASVDYFDYVLPGMLALGLMNFTMVGIAGSVARYGETKVLRRLTVAPISPVAFVAGQVLARVVIALGQVVLLLVLGIALGGTVAGNPLWLLLLATLGNLIFLALGVAIAGRVSSVDAANNLAGVATMPLMFLSGMFFPLASLPPVARLIGELLPITPLVTAMRAVSLHGAGLTEITSELLWLGLWVPLSLLVARLAFQTDHARRPRRRRRASRAARDLIPYISR